MMLKEITLVLPKKRTELDEESDRLVIGLNIPTSMYTERDWRELKDYLGEVSCLYNYPGEEWPFIIPATPKEFVIGITDFSSARTPKFEWVYNSYSNVPVIQFALYTNIKRGQMISILPEPYGFDIPGLEHIFRSVLIESPWEGIKVRIDLYYLENEVENSDWKTAEWLVTTGGSHIPQ